MVERNNLNLVTNPEKVLRTVVPGVKAKDYKVNYYFLYNLTINPSAVSLHSNGIA